MKAAAVGWEQIRGKLLSSIVESAGMFINKYTICWLGEGKVGMEEGGGWGG